MATRAAIYSRVSTRDQDTENQAAALRAYCEAQGFKIVATYTDQESGKTSDRAGFQKMLADAGGRRFDVLIFWSLDRLSREGVAATIQHLTRLQAAGVQFKSLKQPEIDTTATWGWVIVAIFAALAEIERKILSERTKAGMERARKEGRQIGRPPASCKMKTPQLRSLIADGASLKRIAEEMQTSRATAARYRTALIKQDQAERDGAERQGAV